MLTANRPYLTAEQMIKMIALKLPEVKIKQTSSVTIFSYQFPVCWVNVWEDKYQVILRSTQMSERIQMQHWESDQIDPDSILNMSFYLKQIQNAFYTHV